MEDTSKPSSTEATVAQASEQRLRLILSQLPAIMWTVDRELRFTSSLGAGLSALGLQENQVIGVSLTDYFQSDDPEFPALKQHQRALQGESVEFEFQWGKRLYQVRLEPLRHVDGSVEGVLGLAVDVTEIRRLQDQVEQSTRLESIGRLAGGIAHDFNNMLAAISGFAELALIQLPESSPARASLEHILQAVERASQLVNQLLAFARRRMIAPQAMSVNEHLQQLIPFLQRVLGEDVELQCILDEQTGNVRADPVQVEQVLMNLASNARQAMPNGGKLIIETQNIFLDEAYVEQHWGVQSGEYVLISLTDTGHGIAPEHLPHIFEPFYSARMGGSGTGLGLATVHGIVNQARGHIWVYSEPNKGTTFKIYLPRIEEEAEPLPTRPIDTPAQPGSGVILVVEDNDDVRQTMCEMLRILGYTVLEASRPQDALRLAAVNTLDLLITDIVLPEMRGAELARALSVMHPAMKVLFVSGYTENAIIEQGELKPGVEFLGKPFTMAQLSAKVKQILTGG
ncbi:MAG: ATP-binding protein [Fimbriimonadales bacterium]|nr:ATP-binding protein [Fimbriimonadales bacterium]